MWIISEVAEANNVVSEVDCRSDEQRDGEEAEGGEDVLVHDAYPKFLDILDDQCDEHQVQQEDERFHHCKGY